MIRLVYTLRRQPGMSREEFQDYWKRKHGPMVAGFASDLDVLRYVQTHTLDDPLNQAAQQARGNMEPEYDGVAELWWSTETGLAAALDSDEGQRAGAALLEDERTFIDLPNSPLWFAYEYPQVNPIPENIVARHNSNIVRVFFPLRHLPSITEDAARHYWLTQHGPIVRSGAVASGVLCYRQVHRANHALDSVLQEARGTQVDSYLGHAEAWVDRSTIPDTEESRRAGQSFIDDEHNFIDMTRSTFLYGKEHTFVDLR